MEGTGGASGFEEPAVDEIGRDAEEGDECDGDADVI
jgi:hypothetical protein